MNRKLLLITGVLACLLQGCGSASFDLTDTEHICYVSKNEELRQAALFLSDWIKDYTGNTVKVTNSPETASGRTIEFSQNPNVKKEGFKLDITSQKIKIEVSDEAGAFYAAQEIRKRMLQQERGSVIELVTGQWEEHPATGYRGAMLDVSRHFFTVPQVKRFIDLLAFHRLNYFHWHLTDDQGWRIEIKQYPELIKTAAYRGEGDKRYGGFYTQEEIKEVVAYAAERQITIIPEIDLPGHSSAALAAYPSLGCTGGPYQVTTAPGGVHKDVLCIGSSFAQEFVKDVLKEVAMLFPGPYIHIGGDEVPHDRWEKCPRCQAMIARYGLKDADDRKAEDLLQGRFNVEVATFLKTLNKRMVGWDEILSGDITGETIVMSWRSLNKGWEAVRRGNSVILSSHDHFYFNNYQSKDMDNEPLATGSLVPMKTVYEAPLWPDDLTKEEYQKVYGAEACLWTSFVPDEETMDYMLLPRLAAFSDLLWKGRATKGYSDFLSRLPEMLTCYERLGYRYAPHFFEIEPDYKPIPGEHCIEIGLTTLPEATIYYTLDGSEPTEAATKYKEAIRISQTTSLRAAAYLPNGIRSDIFRKEVNVNKATFADIRLLTQPDPKYAGNRGVVLVDGIRSDRFVTTGLWIGYHPGPLEAVLDLKETKELKEAGISGMMDMGAHIMGVKSVDILLSADGESFEKVASNSYQAPPGDWVGKRSDFLKLTFDSRKARFVKVIVKGFDALPANHAHAGAAPFIFIDEIELH